MAIQFPCDNCRKKIEVDDEYAGREAQCPYCETVVRVPHETVVETPPIARAADTFEPHYQSAPPPLPQVPPQPQQRGKWTSVIALAISLIGSALLMMSLATLKQELTDFFGDNVDNLTIAQQQEFAEHFQQSPEIAMMAMFSLGGMLAALIGFLMGVGSLRRQPQQNLAGWLATFIGGAWLLLMLVGVVAQLAG